MGIVTLRKCTQPGREKAPSIFSSFRFQSMHVHVIQIVFISLLLFPILDPLREMTSFFSFCSSIKMLLGFHLLPPKAENESSPAEDLGVTGHQSAINWERILLAGKESDKIRTLKNPQYFKSLHTIQQVFACVQRHTPSDYFNSLAFRTKR